LLLQIFIQQEAGFEVMSPKKRKEDAPIRGFRPPMDEASSPSHDAHIKRLREQEEKR
jgi:hypothetical protein